METTPDDTYAFIPGDQTINPTQNLRPIPQPPAAPTAQPRPAIPLRQASHVSNYEAPDIQYDNNTTYELLPIIPTDFTDSNPQYPSLQPRPANYEELWMTPTDSIDSTDLTPQFQNLPPLDVKNENLPRDEQPIYSNSGSPPPIPTNRSPPPPAVPRDTNVIEQLQSPNLPPFQFQEENLPTNEQSIYANSGSPPPITTTNRRPPPPAVPRDMGIIEQQQSPKFTSI